MGLGDFGISVDEGDEVVGDGEVVGGCLLGYVVFDVGWEFEGECGGAGGVFWGSSSHGVEFTDFFCVGGCAAGCQRVVLLSTSLVSSFKGVCYGVCSW